MAGQRYELTHRAGRYLFRWQAEKVLVQVDQVKMHRDGRTTCRLKVTAAGPKGSTDLYLGQLNLVAVRSRIELARALEERRQLEANSWDRILEEVCQEVLRREQARTPVVQLELTSEPPAEPEYVAPPLVLARSIQVLYGPGGTGKSLVLMYLALCVHNGLTEWWPGVQKRNVLYLDWETDYETAMRRANMLARSLMETGRQIELPFYRRCLRPLADDASDIALDVVEHDVGMLAIDSAGPACGGDIAYDETALKFFGAARMILAENDACALAATHVTKMERRGEGKRLPIGSIYFENIPRLTWEIRREDQTEDSLLVGMYNVKANECLRHHPLAFRFCFFPQGILVTPETIEDLQDEEKTQEQLVLEFLRYGAKTTKDVSQYLEVSVAHARVILNRLKNKQKVVKLDQQSWGLLTPSEKREW